MSNAPIGLPHIIRSKVYIGPRVSSANQNLLTYYSGIRAGRVIFDILEIYYRFRLIFNFVEHSQLEYRSKITFYVLPKYFGVVKLEEVSGLSVIPMFTTHFSVIKYLPGIITNYLVVIGNILTDKKEYKKVINKNISSYFPDISVGLIDSNCFTNFARETSKLGLPSISFSDIASQALGLLTYGIPANFSYNSVHLLANTIFMSVKSAYISRMLKFRFLYSSFVFEFFKSYKTSIFKNFPFFVTLINTYIPFKSNLFSFLNFFIISKSKSSFLKPEVISHYWSNFITPNVFLEFCNNGFKNNLYYNFKFLNFIFLFRITFSQLINFIFFKNKKDTSKISSKNYSSLFDFNYLSYYNIHSYFANFFYFKFLTPYLKTTSQYFNSNYQTFSLKSKISHLYLNLRATCSLLPNYFIKFKLLAKTCRRTITILLKLKMLRLRYPHFSFSILLKSLLSSSYFKDLYVYPNLFNYIQNFSGEINYGILFKILFYYSRQLLTILQDLLFKCKDSFYSIKVQSHQLLQFYSLFFTNEYLLKSSINSQMVSLKRYIKFLGENIHDTFFANVRFTKFNSILKKKYFKLKYNHFLSLKLKYSQPLTIHRLNIILSRVILKKFDLIKSNSFLEDYLYSLCYYIKTSHLIIKKNLDYLVSIRRLLFDYQRHSKLFFTNRLIYQLEFLLNLPYPKRVYEDYLIAIKLGTYSDYTIECIYRLLKPYFKPYHYYYLLLELYKRSSPKLTYIDFRKMAIKTSNSKYLSSMKNALRYTLTDRNSTRTTRLFKLVNFFGRTRANNWVRPSFSNSELQYYAIEKRINSHKRLPPKYNFEKKLLTKRLSNKLITLRRSNVTRFYRIVNRLLKVSSGVNSYIHINTLIEQSSYKKRQTVVTWTNN